MKTIIIGFSVPKKLTWFAKLIMWVENTPYDHVYVKWNWASVERDIIYQASKLAVNFETNKTFDEHAITLEEYELPISDEVHKEVMQFCMDNSGKPYGIKNLFGLLWMKANERFGRKVDNPWPSYGASFVCCKLGAAVVQMSGIEVKESLDDVDLVYLNKILKDAGLKRIV